jgi:hypothetical protein
VVATTFWHNAELTKNRASSRKRKKLDHAVLMKVIKSMIIDLEHIDLKDSKFLKEEPKCKE